MSEGKNCTKCKLFKSYALFTRNRSKRDGYSSACYPCQQVDRIKAIERGWKKKKYPYKPGNDLWKKIGMTQEVFEVMSEAQGHACAICLRSKPLFVDHDHKTGAVRGLLCHRCNVGVGLFGDHLDGFLRALEYLRCHEMIAS